MIAGALLSLALAAPVAYYVPRAGGVWELVPADAVVTEPNRVGVAILWLTTDGKIRCFLPAGGV